MNRRIVAAVASIGVLLVITGSYLLRKGDDANRSFVALAVVASLLVGGVAVMC